jgi:hypothetical protein
VHSHLEKPLLVTLIYNTPGVGWVKHHLNSHFCLEVGTNKTKRPYSMLFFTIAYAACSTVLNKHGKRDRENEFCMLAFSCKSNIGRDIEC